MITRTFERVQGEGQVAQHPGQRSLGEVGHVDHVMRLVLDVVNREAWDFGPDNFGLGSPSPVGKNIKMGDRCQRFRVTYLLGRMRYNILTRVTNSANVSDYL